MCTAATFLSDDFYFGRNLDYEFSYGDEVTVTPRGYAFSLRRGDTFRTRYAIIGIIRFITTRSMKKVLASQG